MKFYLEMSTKKFEYFYHLLAEINRFITDHDVLFEFTAEVMIISSLPNKLAEKEDDSCFKSVVPLSMVCMAEYTRFVPRRDNWIWFAMDNSDFRKMVDKLSRAAYYTTINARLGKMEDRVG